MAAKLCTGCGGKGFNWKAGGIQSRATGEVIANTYSQGPTCELCGGTGKARMTAAEVAVAALILACLAVLVSVYVIQPLISSWLDNVG